MGIIFKTMRKEFEERRLNKKVDKVIGGYKISVLNYVKKGEFKYNILKTDGTLFYTNNKQEFINYVYKL